MDEIEYTILDAIHDITETDRSFFNVVRFLDGTTRNHIVAAHLRNTALAYQTLRMHMTGYRQRNIVMQVPLGLIDPSGSLMRNFLEPVPVIPTAREIGRATESVVVDDTVCTICQESVVNATRLSVCGHCFHSQCIEEWFTMNARCPVCRHDVRDLQLIPSNNTNDNRVHANQE